MYHRMILIVLLLTSCSVEKKPHDAANGLQLAEGWTYQVIAQWEHHRPDMLHLSHDGHTLYLSFENQRKHQPALGKILLDADHQQEYLLYGLIAGDGLRLDSQGGLWLGEEFSQGMVWHIPQADQFAANQTIDREQFESSASLKRIEQAGRMSHEGLCFSLDGKYLYLLDEWKLGALYRLELAQQTLNVFHAQQGWLPISKADQARQQALALQAQVFQRGEDMETLPDGTIIFAETNTGMIWQLDDRGRKPKVQPFLKHADIQHPDNLEWDQQRQWLWITDDSPTSELWVWDRHQFQRIAHSTEGELTGVETASDGRIWLNLQGQDSGEDQTLQLSPPTP